MGLLFDTDVLIDYLRNQDQSVDYVESVTDPLLVSAATVGELWGGVRAGIEEANLRALLQAFEITPIDASIAEKAGLMRRDYGPSHAAGLIDCFIAATAEQTRATLVTLNRKHFPMLNDVLIPYHK